MTEDQKQKPKPRRKRGRLILALIVLIIVAALALGLGLKVQGYPHGYGNVTARKDPLLRARQKGPIGRILVQHGQHVSKGQLILQLDDSLAKVTLERSQTAVKEAASEIEIYMGGRTVCIDCRHIDQADRRRSGKRVIVAWCGKAYHRLAVGGRLVDQNYPVFIRR